MTIPNALRLFFPDICPICLERGPDDDRPVCQPCYSKLSLISGTVCPKCGAPLHTDHTLCRECSDSPRIWWNLAASAFCFDGLSRSTVHRFKYHGDVSLLPFLGKECYAAWRKRYPDTPVDCITPVPLHWMRKLTRGYNQAEMVCNEISRISHLPMCPLIKRIRWTSPQAQLSRSRRKNNLRNAFAVTDSEEVKGKRILLLDDVMTTGSTLNECSRRLMKAGAAEVNILTIARRL